MRRGLTIGVALALFGSSAAGLTYAQQRPASPGATPAPATPKNAKDDESAAKRTLERAGYRDIRELRPSTDGGWIGNASRNGIDVKVRIDARGYIIER